MHIDLPKDEFEILKQDENEIHLYDKKVDLIYVCELKNGKFHKWNFPRGSRIDIINKLTGMELL